MTRYHLQVYGGKATRFTCPSCEREHCFTRYVDDAGNALSPICGRCNHEVSCGYHYRPREWFRDHPDGKDYHLRAKSGSPHANASPYAFGKANVAKTIWTIPEDLVSQSVKPGIYSNLLEFLFSRGVNPRDIHRVTSEYRLGVTRNRSTIFYQLDKEGRCRTGKIIQYNRETGHRIRDESDPSRINWIHALLKYQKKLPAEWMLSQCLFGEHLLNGEDEKTIALVEAEKTAVIGAMLLPDYIWLATGGRSQLSEEKLSVLEGRRVIAFPDVDAYWYWREKLSQFPRLKIRVSDLLERCATPIEREEKIDIADWLISDLEERRAKQLSTPENIQHYDEESYQNPH